MGDLDHLALSFDTPKESQTEKINNLTVVIFGGTGSIGEVLTEGFLKESVSTIVLVSNNEHELWTSKNKFKEWGHVDHVFCDIRDKEELDKIFLKYMPDVVINAAALKHLNYCEDFPVNTIKTNILGLENLLSLSTEWGVGKFVQISTDKAVESISVMGASKLIGERLCLQWNMLGYADISCVRLGNVLGSRGSLIPQIKHDIMKYNKVFITNKRMTRYVITKDEVWEFVKKVIECMEGGEIFIPKLKEISVISIINSVIDQYDKYDVEIEGIDKGKYEKLREK